MTIIFNSWHGRVFDVVPEGFENRVVIYDDTLEDQLRAANGDAIVLFDGGVDVTPELYGEKNIWSNASPYRDSCESKLWHLAREMNIPMLGICRGSQFMCVMAGGTLYQDLNQQHPHGQHGYRHEVVFTDDAHRYGLVALQETTTFEPGRPNVINSTHHQAVKDVPPDAIVLARAWDKRRADHGVVEALLYPYGIAMQWHPEIYGHNEVLLYVRDMFLNGDGKYANYRADNIRG